MSAGRKNPALDAELERLVAEQAADDTDRVRPHDLSLDEPLNGDTDASFYEIHAESAVDSGPYRKQANRVTPEQVREWRALRNKEAWTYQAIADYAGVQVKTVRTHLPRRGKYKRTGYPGVKLAEQLDQFQAAYEAGASMREIAEVHYEALGYKSWESCRQHLRRELKGRGVVIRRRTLKHGMRSADAPVWIRRKYNRERERARVRARLTRCDAVVRSGRPCRRWAIGGSRYCMVHTEETRSSACRRKWTQDNVLEALRTWAETHGRPPRAQDWAKAVDGHPTVQTVVDLFGKWSSALHEAGLREQKRPKPKKLGRRAKLNRGYKECAQPACTNVVPPKWTYCRDRNCQDARGPAQPVELRAAA